MDQDKKEYRRKWYAEHKEQFHQYRIAHRKQAREYQKKYVAEHKVQVTEFHRKWLAEHKDQTREYNFQYRQRHKASIKEKAKGRYSRLTSQQKEEGRKRTAKYRQRHKERIDARHKEKRKKERLTVFSHYGLACSCCGESTYEFLCIDHMNGGGNKHRKTLKGQGSNSLYKWLIQERFPSGFQTLCHNCNMAKGFYKECPHQAQRNAALAKE